jgi:hypothetical protein
MVYCPKFIPLRLLAFRYTPKALLCLKGAAAAEPQDVRETGDLSPQSRMFLSNRQWPLNNGFFWRLRREVYWARYAGGYQEISSEDARAFVERGIDDGKTSKRWTESTIRRVSAYLTGCCADYGLLERGLRSSRRILPFRISTTTIAYLAYELHFHGVGDNAVLNHEDWKLFGLERDDVLEEMKRLSLKGLVIIQSAGDVVRISWKQRTARSNNKQIGECGSDLRKYFASFAIATSASWRFDTFALMLKPVPPPPLPPL